MLSMLPRSRSSSAATAGSISRSSAAPARVTDPSLMAVEPSALSPREFHRGNAGSAPTAAVTFPTRTGHILGSGCDERDADQRKRWSDTSRAHQLAVDGGLHAGTAPPDRPSLRVRTGPVDQTS